MERTPCLICSSDGSSPFLSVPNRFQISERFSLVKCNACGFAYLNPRPSASAVAAYYADPDYQPHQQKPSSFTDRLYALARPINLRGKRRIVTRLHAQGRLLDVGCATGEFLAAMRRANWEVVGVEPAESARNYAKQEYGLEIYSEIEDVTGPFDVITVWHVIEHVHDAGALMERLRVLLSSDGFLVIAAPNLTSLDARVYGSSWVAYDAPRHLYHFRPSDMQRFLENNGFEVIRQRRLPFDPFYNAIMSQKLSAAVSGKPFGLWGLVKSASVAKASFAIGLLKTSRAASVVYIGRRSTA